MVQESRSMWKPRCKHAWGKAEKLQEKNCIWKYPLAFIKEFKVAYSGFSVGVPSRHWLNPELLYFSMRAASCLFRPYEYCLLIFYCLCSRMVNSVQTWRLHFCLLDCLTLETESQADAVHFESICIKRALFINYALHLWACRWSTAGAQWPYKSVPANRCCNLLLSFPTML